MLGQRGAPDIGMELLPEGRAWGKRVPEEGDRIAQSLDKVSSKVPMGTLGVSIAYEQVLETWEVHLEDPVLAETPGRPLRGEPIVLEGLGAAAAMEQYFHKKCRDHT